ncbi:flagellar motor switch protein FliN [Nitrosomonas sp. ANs5]|uniref:flagellar motor switch protein FliN n=1 Tax=Nitrosomonas sp. ANs5 TaxID=3423941 RepID=UPI003D34DFC7
MNTPTKTKPQAESQAVSDDWAEAMAEQQASDAAYAPQTEAPESPATEASDTDAAPRTGNEELTKSSPVFEQFSNNNTLHDTHNDIDMILDIPVQLTVELGRTRIAIKNLLQLAQGSVVELDGMAGEPMDVLVNGCLIAQGEVVVVNEKFGIRLTDIITPSERIRKLNR